MKPPFLYATHNPDQLEARKAAFERLQEGFPTLMILKTSLVHQDVEDQTQGINEDVPLPPFHFLSAVIPARPPF